MIYGMISNGELIVPAADSAVELEAFITIIATQTGKPNYEYRVPKLLEMLQNNELAGYKKAPSILTFDDEFGRDAFILHYEIQIIGPNSLRSKQHDMLIAASRRAFNASVHSNIIQSEMTDEQEEIIRGETIASLHGIDVDDPWDSRSEEEKAAPAKLKAIIEDAKKKALASQSKGGMTDGSFGNEKETETETKDGVFIRKVTVLADGRIDVSAIKVGDPADEPDNPDLSFEHNGPAILFHRVTVLDVKLADIQPMLLDAGLDVPTLSVARRNSDTGCWFAVLAQRHAAKMTLRLVEAGFKADFQMVNNAGEPMLPKGVEVVEEIDLVSLIRPWNNRAAWDALTDEQKAETIKEIKGEEFVICGMEGGRNPWGCDVIVVPRSWFSENNSIFTETLPLGVFLPHDLKEVSPGHYRSGYRDWLHVSHEFYRNGFRESLMLQMAVNNA